MQDFNKKIDDFCTSIQKKLTEEVYFVAGVEIEFYKTKKDLLSEEILLKIKNIAKKYKIKIINTELEKEDGEDQFEVQTFPTDDLENVCLFIQNLQQKTQDIGIDLLAKPFLEQPASSIHYNFSLYAKNSDINLFAKRYDYEEYCDNLYRSVSRLVEYAKVDIKKYSPTSNCRKRFVYPKPNQKHIHYPVNYCWGINNRTTAFRIPSTIETGISNTRIENRLCSPVADSFECILTTIQRISEGICNENQTIIKPIYGNAFDNKYAFELEQISLFV